MARTILLTCAHGCSVDRFTNTLSIFEILEEITPIQYPLWLPKLTVVAALEKEDGDPDVFHPDLVVSLEEAEIFRQPANISFGGRRRTRMIAHMQGLPVPGPGTLTIRLVGDHVHEPEYSIQMNAANQAGVLEQQEVGQGANE